MELLEKLDILSSKIEELLVRLDGEQQKNMSLQQENDTLKDENRRLKEQNDAVRQKVENLLNRL